MRKLATAALSFSAAIFAANYILPVSWLIVPAVLLAVAAAMLTAMHRKWLQGFVIAMLAFSLGLLNFYVQHRFTSEQAETLAGEIRLAELRLLSYPVDYGDYCRAEVRIVGGDLPRLKAILYDNSDAIGGLRPGSVLRASCKLSTADTLYGKDYDYYNARDIYLKLSTKDGTEILDTGFDLRSLPVYISHGLSERVGELFPKDVSHFMRSLMLGDKSRLYDDEALISDMSRAGFMHIVAVSGMHVAFLVGLVRLLFGATRRSSVVCIILVWSFAFITGAGPSAVRAAVMQSMLLMASVFYRENDPLTSLSTALALILLQNPSAAASVSLQLSFGAMAGIICFSGGIYDFLEKHLRPRRGGRIADYILATLSSSLGVLVFTLPLTALHFGYVALLSVFANIAGLWAVSLCFCGGWISCLLSFVPALGAASAWLCAWLARYIFLIAGLTAEPPFAVLYMQTSGAWLWLGLSYAALIAVLCLRFRPWLKLLLPLGFSAALLAAVMIAARLDYQKGPGIISVIDVGQGQSIAAMAGESTVLIDCGNCFSADNAGELAAAYLMSCGRERIDLLMLTHLHEDHANGVTMLMELMEVETLIIPADAEDSEGLGKAIRRSAEKHGTELRLIDSDSGAVCGGISMEIFAPLGEEGANERALTAKLSVGELDALITADSPAELELELLRSHELGRVELLVVGHHGSKYSSDEEFLRLLDAEHAVISTGQNYYGHPAEETLARLEQQGYNVHRTDIDGTVELRAG